MGQVKKSKKEELMIMLKRLPFVILGSLVFTFGLEAFIVANGLIDGGVVGISIMLEELLNIPFSVFVVLLNIPFFYLGYKQIGTTFCVTTVVAILTVSLSSPYMHHINTFDNALLLGVAFGGAIMGIGVGIVMRAGGTTDGVEILALVVNKKTSFTVGQIIMLTNLVILLASAFVFTPKAALYSILAYYIAFKTIDLVVEGLDKSRAFHIISDNAREIGEVIQARLGRSVTYIKSEGGYDGQEKEMLYVIVSSLEDAKLKTIINDIDKGAFVVASHVQEVKGGRFKKRDIH